MDPDALERLTRLECAQLQPDAARRRQDDILDRQAERRARLEDADGDL